MHQIKEKILCVFVLAGFVINTAFAAGTDFEYPELAVTPRASERLTMEAGKEFQNRWLTHLPIQVSALTTLAAGLLQLGNSDPALDPDKRSAYAGIAVGAGWMVVSSMMAMHYQPYTNAQKEVSALPSKTQREQLTRERVAEEAIKDAAAIGRRLQIISAATNLGAGIYMISKAEANSISKVADGIAIAAALAPFVFRYHWQDVASEQAEYKKRIYAPIASAAVFSEPRTGHAAPGVALSLFF